MKDAKVSEIIKLGATLMLYATVACVGLAFVYAATKTVIEQRSQADLEAALKVVFPNADSFGDLGGAIQSPDASVSFGAQYEALQGGNVIGAAITAIGSSYGGPATVLVGVGADGQISGIKIMELSDTPGLGANAASPGYFVNRAGGVTFYGQFAGKSAADPFEVSRDVIPITAATISSRAISVIVKNAGIAGKTWLDSQRGGVK
ncbi:MAG: FMN-binding protein [Treponema sp.]|jgi:electron transport complex protein RnfG|nr:FMN-binding protein [Treponema sp.]